MVYYIGPSYIGELTPYITMLKFWESLPYWRKGKAEGYVIVYFIGQVHGVLNMNFPSSLVYTVHGWKIRCIVFRGTTSGISFHYYEECLRGTCSGFTSPQGIFAMTHHWQVDGLLLCNAQLSLHESKDSLQCT